jgi:hypothetical protein
MVSRVITCTLTVAALLTVMSAVPARAEQARYTGPGSDQVRRLLNNVGPWSCPKTASSSAGTAPPQMSNGYCVRDRYVKAAVMDAWAAECYWRIRRTSAATEKAAAMEAELKTVRGMCSNATALGGGRPCDTEKLYDCP